MVGMDWRYEYIQAVTQKSGSDAQRGILGNGNGGCKGRKIDSWNWTWWELYNVKNRRMSAEKIPGCIGCFAFPDASKAPKAETTLKRFEAVQGKQSQGISNLA